MKFWSKYKTFHSRKCIWKYRLQNGCHFVQRGRVNSLCIIVTWAWNIVIFRSYYFPVLFHISIDALSYSLFYVQHQRLWFVALHISWLLSIMTSSNGNIFRVAGHLCGNSPVPGEFPARPVTRSFDVFFDLRLNKRLSKQSWGWWFETLSRSLWRHCNASRCNWRVLFHLID